MGSLHRAALDFVESLFTWERKMPILLSVYLWGDYVTPDVRIGITLTRFFFVHIYNNYGGTKLPTMCENDNKTRCTDMVEIHPSFPNIMT